MIDRFLDFVVARPIVAGMAIVALGGLIVVAKSIFFSAA